MQTPLSQLLKDKGSQVFSAMPNDTVLGCVQKMQEYRVGALLVLEGKKIVGIFSERDVSKNVVLAGKDPNTTKVNDVMTTEVAYVKPTTTVEEAMSIVTEKRFRHLPVMEGDELLGMVSIGDLTRWAVVSQQTHIEQLVGYISGDLA